MAQKMSENRTVSLPYEIKYAGNKKAIEAIKRRINTYERKHIHISESANALNFLSEYKECFPATDYSEAEVRESEAYEQCLWHLEYIFLGDFQKEKFPKSKEAQKIYLDAFFENADANSVKSILWTSFFMPYFANLFMSETPSYEEQAKKLKSVNTLEKAVSYYSKQGYSCDNIADVLLASLLPPVAESIDFYNKYREEWYAPLADNVAKLNDDPYILNCLEPEMHETNRIFIAATKIRTYIKAVSYVNYRQVFETVEKIIDEDHDSDIYDYIEKVIRSIYEQRLPFKRFPRIKDIEPETREFEKSQYAYLSRKDLVIQNVGVSYVSEMHSTGSYSVLRSILDLASNIVGDVGYQEEEYSRKGFVFYPNTGEIYTGQALYSKFEGKYVIKFKEGTVKALYEILSYTGNDEFTEAAESVIDYLCRKYNTLIFKDLWRDYKESGGMLLPIKIKKAGEFHNKQELFERYYKIPAKGNWNKRNANTCYAIYKLYSRLSDSGRSRIMQCGAVKTLYGSVAASCRQYDNTVVYANHLYATIYPERFQTLSDLPLQNLEKINKELAPLNDELRDEIEEEVKSCNFSFLPPRQLMNIHRRNYENRQYEQYDAIVPEIRIKENTKFKKLIKNMPKVYELINNKDRIIKEGIEQKNCVATYAEKINEDQCVIYSYSDGEHGRHTIEIRQYTNGEYYIQQCLQRFNREADEDVFLKLDDEIDRINNI